MPRVRQSRVSCRDEGGSALMAVLGVMAVTMVIALTITAATINGLSTTSSTRASVQSRAAAEAGIDSALVAMSAPGACRTAPVTSADVPVFSATIEYLNVAEEVVTCSRTDDPTQVRITSMGTASGDTSSIEAVYGYSPFEPAIPPIAAIPPTPGTPGTGGTPGTPATPAIPPGIAATGAAMYLYGGIDFKNISPISSTGALTGVQVKSGNFDCSNNTTVKGDVVVERGTLTLKKCIITGNVWVSGVATLSTNSEIRGNLNAANASRPSLVTGSYNVPITVPTVPDWVDFGYEPAKWVNTDGSAYTVKTLVGCNLTSANAANTAAPNKPLILNGLGCATLTASANVTLANDLVIFAHGFDFTGKASGLTFGSSTARKLWFITPDGNSSVVADKKPSCSGQGDFRVKNGFTIASKVSAMLYTPCSVSTGNRPKWVGQLYVGAPSSTWNDIDFKYAGLGLPGVNLSNGSITTGSTPGAPGFPGSPGTPGTPVTPGTPGFPGVDAVPGVPAVAATVDALVTHRDLAG